jgi:hypothetical protein
MHGHTVSASHVPADETTPREPTRQSTQDSRPNHFIPYDSNIEEVITKKESTVGTMGGRESRVASVAVNGSRVDAPIVIRLTMDY